MSFPTSGEPENPFRKNASVSDFLEPTADNTPAIVQNQLQTQQQQQEKTDTNNNNNNYMNYSTTTTPSSSSTMEQFQIGSVEEDERNDEDSFTPSTNTYIGSGSIDPYSSSSFQNPGHPSSLQQQSQNNSFLGRIQSIFSIQGYRSHFDVNTKDVQERVIGSIKYANVPDYFREQVLGINLSDGKGPDLYGPIWICLSLVFLVAVTSNVSKYLHSESLSDFEYDISHLFNALVVLSTFTFGLPLILFILLRCLSVELSYVELVSLYGYSLIPYLPATLLCLIPITILEWIVLALATAASLLLILRNIAGPILRNGQSSLAGQKAGSIIICVMVCHGVLLLILKLMFYHHKSIKRASNGSSPDVDPNDDAISSLVDDDGDDGDDGDGDNGIE
mmetsp:Transcript_5409/g.7868  ORF Transcript_5409/g.7868 Transcript_5409/m.7868 type:complete len:391 (-) Transcript_5409:11-1183(-)